MLCLQRFVVITMFSTTLTPAVISGRLSLDMVLNHVHLNIDSEQRASSHSQTNNYQFQFTLSETAENQ